jgi:acyl-CoA thioesterase
MAEMVTDLSEDLIKFFENDRFAFENGMKVTEIRHGWAVAEMQIEKRHLNGVGTVQGGAIFTLADLAFAAACNSYGIVTVAINANITYFKPPKGDTLTARANEVSRSKTLCSYNIDVFDGEGDLVARFTGNGFIKKERLELMGED